MQVKSFFHTETSTLTYIVFDEDTKDAVVIDPVLDYDPGSSTYSFESIDKILEFVSEKLLKVHFIIETHAHADHLSGGQEIKRRISGSRTAIGHGITTVQKSFKQIFNFDEGFMADGSQFDCLFKDGDVLSAGSLQFKVMHTPGHTPSCYSYKINDSVFVGDALFMPDFGVARCDFPSGSAEELYDSITEKLYTLPDDTQIYTGHDYQPGGRELQFQTTIGESKKSNIYLNSTTTKDEFVKKRTQRDQALKAPRLLLPSIQVNANGGILPEPEENGVSYMKLPITKK